MGRDSTAPLPPFTAFGPLARTSRRVRHNGPTVSAHALPSGHHPLGGAIHGSLILDGLSAMATPPVKSARRFSSSGSTSATATSSPTGTATPHAPTSERRGSSGIVSIERRGSEAGAEEPNGHLGRSPSSSGRRGLLGGFRVTSDGAAARAQLVDEGAGKFSQGRFCEGSVLTGVDTCIVDPSGSPDRTRSSLTARHPPPSSSLAISSSLASSSGGSRDTASGSGARRASGIPSPSPPPTERRKSLFRGTATASSPDLAAKREAGMSPLGGANEQEQARSASQGMGAGADAARNATAAAGSPSAVAPGGSGSNAIASASRTGPPASKPAPVRNTLRRPSQSARPEVEPSKVGPLRTRACSRLMVDRPPL